MNDRIYVAKLGKAVGLKGHLRLFIESDFPEQFKKGTSFTTNKNLTLTIEEYNPNRDLVKFQDYNDVDTAKRLTNQFLYTTIEQTKNSCNLENNEYFWFDIINCNIKENNQDLGKVVEIHRYPLEDYLEIKTAEDLVKKNLPKTFLIPYNVDNYILNVDIKNKEIEVKNSYEILENS
ncbi:16S rRNA processing protein RimM [Halarcobacter mediterraneus]|uniref:Ribosome maturation factor RimM n=1 Tax=Halarcobacter mediterraneus TaxID=2023153 RepID=A0A4Q1ATR4_9BACT|nr:ribosome maturation factor RimM [Halarcobacter mediterraneus]RXK11867.1 16S rRNA processing protein RimM [Halarcobacter mediterraneus]